MTSKTEAVLDALATLIDNQTTAKFERNASVPEKIPPQGMIILRDGNPGAAETTLGGFDTVYYEHEVEIEVFFAEGEQTSRDAGFDALVVSIGAALESDASLGGLIFGISYARPDVSVEIIPGADAIKLGTIDLVLDYESYSPLA